MDVNKEDLELFLSDGIFDKDGILLIEKCCLPILHAVNKRYSSSSEDETYTVRILLKGNILGLYDVGSTKLKYFLILERVAAQFIEPTAILPYAFSLTAGSENFRFSAFSEEDRTEWVHLLAQCSQELLNARMLTLKERVNDVLKTDYVRLESELKSKIRSDIGGKGSSPNLYQSDPLQPNDDANVFTALYENVIIKKLKIETGSGVICCREHMAEPKITSTLPLNLMRIYKDNVLRVLDQLSNIFYLPTNWDAVRLHHMKRLRELIKRYDDVINFLNDYCGPPFKASQCKDRTEFSFLPTNLHLQRFSVLNSVLDDNLSSTTSSRWTSYDFMTCGAFTAYAQGYGNGGAKKFLKKLRQSLPVVVDDQANNLLSSSSASSSSSWSNCDWSKLSSMQTELLVIDGQLKQLKLNLSKWTPKNEQDFEKIVKFAAEVRTLAEQLRQICDSTSHVVGSVDDLMTFYEKYDNRRLSTSAKISSGSLGVDNFSTNFSLSTNGRDFSTSTTNDQSFKLESIESQREDIEAEVACLVTKVENLSHLEKCSSSTNNDDSRNDREAWCRSLSVTACGVVVRLEKFVRTIVDGVLFSFLKSVNAPDVVAMYYELLYRQNVIFSQSLTTVSAALLNQLWMTETCEISNLTQPWCTCGALLVVHSYLSCYQNEKGMLEDLAECIRFLRQNCSFRITRSFANVKTCHPVIDGNWSNVKITLPVPASVFDCLAEPLRKGDWFYVAPILFSVGINHEETLAHKLGDTSFEMETNDFAFKTYKTYIQRWVREEYGSGRSVKEVHRILDEIHRIILAKQSKNVDLLHSSTELCRLLNGALIICCKSGKDRTAMAVTAEEGLLLRRFYNLPETHLQSTLDLIRRDGTRLENTLKNIGARRYAFTSLQLNLLPVLYRPPKGCYGSVHT